MKNSRFKLLARILIVAVFALNGFVFLVSTDVYGNQGTTPIIDDPNYSYCYVGNKWINPPPEEKTDRYCGNCKFEKVQPKTGHGFCRRGRSQ